MIHEARSEEIDEERRSGEVLGRYGSRFWGDPQAPLHVKKWHHHHGVVVRPLSIHM